MLTFQVWKLKYDWSTCIKIHYNSRTKLKKNPNLTLRPFSQICVVRVSRFFSNLRRVCNKFFHGIFTPTWCSGNVFMKIFFQNSKKWLSFGNNLFQCRHTEHMLNMSSKLGTNENITLIISAGNKLISHDSSPSFRGRSKRGNGAGF